MVDLAHAALGFDDEDFAGLADFLHEEFEAQDFETDFYPTVTVHQDGSGVRASVFDSEFGPQAVMSFATGKPMLANVYRVIDHLALAQLLRPDGSVFNQVACACDEAFHLPPGNPVGGEALRTDQLELSAWAMEHNLYGDAAEWREKSVVVADGGDVPENLAPEMLYSASVERFHQDLNPRRVTPFATLSAEIAAVERRTNNITGTDLYACEVALPTGTLALILPAREDSPEPKAGNVFAGDVFMSATVGYWADRLDGS